MNFKKRLNGSWVDTSCYIHKTATDTITTLPAVIYADGNNATVGISGNTVQNGTPTPANPIMPQGTGERTANLFDYNVTWWRNNVNDSTNHTDISTTRIKSDIQDISDSNSYISLKIFAPITNMRIIGIGFFGDDVTTKLPNSTTITITNTTIIQQIPTGAKHYFILLGDDTAGITSDTKTALASAQICAIYGDVLPNTFIPYGYKIPISSANTTTPVYLGQVQSTRRIKKLVLTGEEDWVYQANATRFVMTINNIVVFSLRDTPFFCTHYIPISDGRPIGDVPFDAAYLATVATNIATLNIKIDTYTTAADFKSYLAAQYANGTPVTVWYVLATEETGIVNEPLRKIGDYADTVSGITIPTIAGTNALSIGTTLQPSEVTVGYKGWHPVQSVHEYDSDYTIATMQTLTIAQLQTHTISKLQGGGWS